MFRITRIIHVFIKGIYESTNIFVNVNICAWYIVDRTFTIKEKEVRGWNFHVAHSVLKSIYKQLKPPYVHLRQERTISEINVSSGCLNRSCFRFSWRKQRWDASSLINKYGGGMKWNSLKRRERALRMWLYIRPDVSLLRVISPMNKRLILIITSWKFRRPITFVASQRLIRNSKIESPLKRVTKTLTKLIIYRVIPLENRETDLHRDRCAASLSLHLRS